MQIPRVLREQVKQYERAGFHVKSVEHRAGSHFKVEFEEFPDPQFLTCNIVESHSIRNNIARFRRCATGIKS